MKSIENHNENHVGFFIPTARTEMYALPGSGGQCCKILRRSCGLDAVPLPDMLIIAGGRTLKNHTGRMKRMKNQIWAVIIWLLVAVSSFCAGYTYKSILIIREPIKIQYVVTNETDAEFKRLQEKHGQENTIILKQEFVYYKNRKRCVLK